MDGPRGTIEHNKSCVTEQYMNFIDLEKDFDRIKWGKYNRQCKDKWK